VGQGSVVSAGAPAPPDTQGRGGWEWRWLLSPFLSNPVGTARDESQEHEETKETVGWETKREKCAFRAGSNTPAL